jgi:hypothetical protein
MELTNIELMTHYSRQYQHTLQSNYSINRLVKIMPGLL